jgi:hypothetical protein
MDSGRIHVAAMAGTGQQITDGSKTDSKITKKPQIHGESSSTQEEPDSDDPWMD